MADDPSTAFLKWAYGDQYPEVLVFYTAQDPGLRGYGWAMTKVGDLERRGLWPPGEQTNNYFCVSLCQGDRRQAVYWKSLHVLAIDDVGTKVPEGILLDRFGVPGWVWETSPGNQQWFWKLAPPVRDRDVALQLVHLLKNDAKDIVKLMRLPVGKNNKAKYGLGDAGFKTRIIARADQVSVNSGLNSHGRLDPAEVLASWDADSVPEELKPNKPTGLSGALSTRPGKSVLDLIGEDPLGKCLLAMGRVKHMIPSRLGLEIVCPWEHEHTVRTETGSAYFPETGGFECHHGHCQDRTGKDLRAVLEEEIAKSGLWEGGVLGVAGRGFDPVQDAVTAEADRPYREVLLEQYVFVENAGKFMDFQSNEMLPVESFNKARAEAMRNWTMWKSADGKKSGILAVDKWFFQNNGRSVTAVTNWPGRGLIFDDDRGVPVANRWRPGPRPFKGRVVDEKMIQPWHELVTAICVNEGPEAAERLIDWFALVVHIPDVKPGWHPIIQSDLHGVGKELILRPVGRAVGERNWDSPAVTQLSGNFNAYLEKRLVSVSDLKRNTPGMMSQHDIYATLKPWTENTSPMLRVNPKGSPEYRVRNVTAWYITTNERDALGLAQSDRRFFVVLSTMTPRASSYYDGVIAWLDRDGNEDLIGEYLHQRCETMPAARRLLLTGHAPMTAGKQEMALLGEDKLTAWIREQIEDGVWPDLMLSQDIQMRIEQAGRRVLGWVPTGQKWGPILTKLKGLRLNDGKPIRVGDEFGRVWAVRNSARYQHLSPKQIANAYALFTL